MMFCNPTYFNLLGGSHYRISWSALTLTNILALDLGLNMKRHKRHLLIENLLEYWWIKARILDSHAAGFYPIPDVI